ncbi:MAG TPA: efflux RND transporter periplasmic adaptor subunit, partial [Anaerolineales bacterium]|nr:efflux RND transporter periplasmic adaptor subunit [Anaerolineales bacterium]
MKKWITPLIIVLALAAAFYFFQQSQAQQTSTTEYQTQPVSRGTLTAIVGATGTVRSNQSAWLTWDTSGTVAQVDGFVGMNVAKGDVLASLEQTSLAQNVILAQADLVSAQQNLDALYDTALQQAQAQQAVEDAQQALDDLLNPELQQAKALQAIADAEKAVDDTARNLSYLQSPASQADIDAQKAQVILAEDALQRAQDNYAPYENKPEDNLIRANLLAKLSAAQESYDAAVRTLNGLLADTADPVDLAVAEAELATAQANLTQAQRDYEDIKDGPSPAEVALAEANLADAQENYNDLLDGPASDDIAAAEARVAAAQANLAQIALTAPFAGEITAVKALPGDQVTANTQAFRLDDLSRLLVDVEISEVDINQIKVGQSVELTFDAIIGSEYQGKVTEISPVGEETQGVVNFLVTVELLNPDEQVKPGMTAAVSIITSTLEDVLVVPSRAVRTVNDELVVYVLENGLPTPITITLGASYDSMSEVLTGDLTEGAPLILNPPSEPMEIQGPGNGGGPFGG